MQRHWKSRSAAVIRSILGVSAIVSSQKAATHENDVEIGADGTCETHTPIAMKLKRLPLGHQPTRLMPTIALHTLESQCECVLAAFLCENEKICRGKSGIVWHQSSMSD